MFSLLVIEDLAMLERGAGSPGEEVAAHRLRGRFESAGCTAVVDEEESIWRSCCVCQRSPSLPDCP